MGLDDIQLDVQICSKLFPGGLVYDTIPKAPESKKISFDGKNLNSVLVLIDENHKLKTEDADLLNNLLKACQLTQDDIALVNLGDQEAVISEILNFLKSEKAIFFGIPFSTIDLNISDEEDKILEAGNCKLIRTLPLGSLQKNTDRKKALWKALKELFEL